MMTAMTILGTGGVFIVGIAARAALILAVFAVLALPIAGASWVLHVVGERWHRYAGPHGVEARAHR
jgi:hypothetical protein